MSSGVPFGDDQATAAAAFGTHVDDPVGRFDDVEVVLDNDDGVAAVGKALQDAEQFLDVGEVETGGRFVQDVHRAAGGSSGQLGRELDPLCLAAGKLGGRLAEVDVAQSDILQRLQLVLRILGMFSKNCKASVTVISSTSAIDLPLKGISSASRLYRRP